MPELVRVNKDTSDLLKKVKAVTGISYTEITARSLLKFVDNLPEPQKAEIKSLRERRS